METARPEVKEAVDSVLLKMPGVEEGKAFGYPAYKINGKVFAYITGQGPTIKIGSKRVQELVAKEADVMKMFDPGTGRVWKDWVSIDRKDASAHKGDEALFAEAISFTSK